MHNPAGIAASNYQLLQFTLKAGAIKLIFVSKR